MNQNETIQGRRKLVAVAPAMLDGTLSFVEGAQQVLTIRNELGGRAGPDSDFDAFEAIRSASDHLPLEAQRPLWAPAAIARLEPEFKRTEDWARSFGTDACKRLIARFSTS
jgi:hypothetical protein